MATVNLIGRDAEQRVLGQVYDEPRAQLVAVYGRRRVGKTFLVKTFFARRMAFCFTGVYGATAKMQLGAFAGELGGCMGKKLATPKNWFEAFGLLRNYLESLPTERKVVFLDEMPWLDTPRSDFLAAFSFFWNNWAETQEGLKIIVCGSAASWMVEKLVGSKGGLYGRLSRTIYLRPFTLGETEQFLLSRG
ncbi:MAG: ATP-binding protein, partial [Duodenibacillus sp.]